MGRTGQGTEKGSCPFLVSEREKAGEKLLKAKRMSGARTRRNGGTKKSCAGYKKFPVGINKGEPLAF